MRKLLKPFVSIVIPVYNDEQLLQTCLAALSQQTYPSDCYEIIVVDNGSDCPECVEAVTKTYPMVRLVVETTPGSYAARNRGIAVAMGEIIAFTDADCVPASDWLEAGVSSLSQRDNCGFVAGKIQLFLINSQHPTMVELYESIRALPQQEFVEQHHYGATANLFTTRQVIERVGKFNAKLKSSGDVEWGKRVYGQGYCQIYDESVLVRHPTRTSWQELYHRTRRLAGGYYDLQVAPEKSSFKRQIIFMRTLLQNSIPPVFFAINLFINNPIQGVSQKLKIIMVMILVRHISAWETLRLKFGSISSRI